MPKQAFLAFAPWLAVAMCAACATPVVRGGEIRNATSSTIYDVRVVHQPTQRSVFTNQIPPGEVFMLAFSPRESNAKSADFTWRNARGQACATKLEIPAGPASSPEDPVWVIYTIRSNTNATVELVPARR